MVTPAPPGPLWGVVLPAPHVAAGATLALELLLQALAAQDLVGRGLSAAPGPGLLAEDMLLAAAVGLVVAAAGGRGLGGRLAGAGLAGLAWTYLLADHLHWRLTARHLQLEPLKEGAIDPVQLRDSLAAEAGPGLVLAALLALAAAAWLLARLESEPARPRPFRPVLGAALLLGLLAAMPGPTRGVEASLRHPLPVLAASLAPARAPAAIPRRPDLDLGRPVFGAPAFPADAEALAWAAAARARSHPRPPDVVFLVLESVGATTFLSGDDLDAEALPTLAGLSDRALLLPRIYTPFPGTTRAHLHLLTGGHTLTWGDLREALAQRFEGPTLPRTLRAAGYQSALLSTSYAFHSLPRLYDPEPFDRRNFPFAADAYPEAKLNSWGVSERILVDELDAWLPTLAPDRPAFLMLHNQATHHPYSWPADHAVPFPVTTRRDRHRAAMHFTDAVLGQLLERWRAAGRLENTLLVVVGDHGEAFGRFHSTNFIHRDQLYEENMRSFLYLVDLRREPGRLTRAARHGGLGDVFPTLAGLLGLPPPEVPGQDLLAAGATPRLHFLHKFGVPERWGLVDGRFKFSLEAAGLSNPALFDLAADPTEQHDLAAGDAAPSPPRDAELANAPTSDQPDPTHQIPRYTELASEWILRAQEDLARHLPGYHPTGAPDLAARAVPGPHQLLAGAWPEGGRFREARALAPTSVLALKAAGAPYAAPTELTFTFTDPAGQVSRIRKRIEPGWTTYGVRLLRPPPHPEGAWRAAVFRGDQRLASTRFQVEAGARDAPPAP